MYMDTLFFWNSFQKNKQETVPKLWKDLNYAFITVLSCSFVLYISAAIVIAICIYFYWSDRRRQGEIQRRREQMQRAQERPPPKRRPGAAYRDHQIFRNVLHIISKYMKNPPPFVDGGLADNVLPAATGTPRRRRNHAYRSNLPNPRRTAAQHELGNALQ